MGTAAVTAGSCVLRGEPSRKDGFVTPGDAMMRAERSRFASQALASQRSMLRTRRWPRPRRTAAALVPRAIASRKQISVSAQKSARKRHRPGKAKPWPTEQTNVRMPEFGYRGAAYK